MCVLDEQVGLIGQVSASLSDIDTAHQWSYTVSIYLCWLKRHKAYVLMELRGSAGYYSYHRGKATGTVGCDKEERCTFLLERGTFSKFLSGDNSTPLPSQDLTVPLLFLCL